MLADKIMEIAKSELTEQGYRIRPSMVRDKKTRCLRQYYYAEKGYPMEDFDGRTAIVFEDGREHERQTIEMLKRGGVKIVDEQRPINKRTLLEITPFVCEVCGERTQEGVMHGHIDWVTLDEDRPILTEHKAINGFAFDRYWGGDLPDGYFSQMALYMTTLKIPDGLLLVKNKNTGAFLEYHVSMQYEDLLVEKVIKGEKEKTLLVTIPNIVGDWMDYLERMQSLTDVPPREHEYKCKFPCGYCRYENLCWEGYAEELDSLKVADDLDNELTDRIAYIKQLSGDIREMEKEKKELERSVKQAMVEQGIKQGVAGDYTVRIGLVDVEGGYREPYSYERLYVQKRRS